MRVEQFDAVAVGIAEIDEHRVPRPVPPGPALDRQAEAETARHVAGFQQVGAFLRKIGEVMQPWARAVEEHDVVRIALALQEHAAQRAAAGDVFGEPEADLVIEAQRARHVRREDLVVVDALRAAAAMARELRDLPRHHRHARAELQRRSHPVGDVQRAALERRFGPCHRAAVLLEEAEGFLQVLLAQHAQADARAHRRVLALPQHQAVVAGLLDAAVVQGAVGFLGEDEADHFLVEAPARLQIGDGQDHVARPRHVEGRPQDGFRQVHGGVSSSLLLVRARDNGPGIHRLEHALEAQASPLPCGAKSHPHRGSRGARRNPRAEQGRALSGVAALRRLVRRRQLVL